VRILVRERSGTHQVPAAVPVVGDHIRGPGHGGRERDVHVLRLANCVADTVRLQHRQLFGHVPGAGVVRVAPGQRPRPRSGRCRGVAGRRTGGRDRRPGAGHRAGRQRRRTHGRRGRHRKIRLCGVLEKVHRPDRLEADNDHHAVLHLPAGQWVLRAAVLLDGRAAQLPCPVGRRHRHRVPVPVPVVRQPGLLDAAPCPPQDSGLDVRRRHGPVAYHHHRLHAHVRRHGRSALRCSANRRVRRLRVLRPVGHATDALDPLRRGVPDGRQRFCIIHLLFV